MAKYTEESLNKLSVGKLVELYNTKAETTVNGFRNKETAVARCLDLFSGGKGKEKKPPAEKKPRVIKVFQTEAANEITEPKEGSKREKFLKFLEKKGRTIDECTKEFEWMRRNVLEACRLLNTKCGFGFSLSDKGVIKVLR